MSEKPSKREIQRVMRELGRRGGKKGGKKGGKSRWTGMTPEERSEFMRKAAQKRWAAKKKPKQ